MKCFDRPVILVDGIFGDSMASKFMDNIISLEEEEIEAVVVLINSPGGSVDALKAMVDVMQSTEIHITTIATGLAASCGLLLLMAGDHRMAYRTASLMSHQYSSGSRGKHHELQASVTMQKQMHAFMLEHYMTHTGLPSARILKELLSPTDVWLTAFEAQKYNLIDDICAPYAKPIGFKEKTRYKAEYDKKNVAAAYQVLKEAGRIKE